MKKRAASSPKKNPGKPVSPRSRTATKKRPAGKGSRTRGAPPLEVFRRLGYAEHKILVVVKRQTGKAKVTPEAIDTLETRVRIGCSPVGANRRRPVGSRTPRSATRPPRVTSPSEPQSVS